MHHNRPRAHLHAVPNRDVAKHLRAAADHDVIPDRRVPFAAIFASPAQRDSLINQNIITDLRRLTNDHAHTMVNEKAPSDLGPRMNLNTRQKSGNLRNESRDQIKAFAVEPMRQPVQQNRVKARITKNDFQHALRGRIFPEDGRQLLANRGDRSLALSVNRACHAISIMTRYSKTVRFLPLFLTLTLLGCNSSKEVATVPATPKGQVESMSKAVPTNGKVHPFSKHLELGGFRITEPKPGSIRIKFNVVNHSQADLGDLDLKLSLIAVGAKPEDAPLTVVQVKVPSLGPEESKAVEVTTPTKLRVYELPDWQFIRALYEITSPAQ